MENKKLTIEDLLKSLAPDFSGSKFDIKEIWNMVANGESWEKMGFCSEKEYKEYLIENPYANI